ncbi:MAG TPA: NrsF family protein [Candidatus Cybelea sp.]|nr:NrsF family protein [Candidatus Cybelea sp.]
MSATENLIAKLSEGLPPVRRLRKPWLRAALWIGFATLLIAVLVLLRGFRADIDECLRNPFYLIPLAGSWLTGATAALAAFEVSLADRSRLWALLPLPAVALWITGFAAGCLADWIAVPAGAPIVQDSVRCLTTILLASAGMIAVLLPMLRRAKTLRPNETAWLGILAVAGFADTAHLLIHVVEASLLVLAINLVPATVIVLLGGLAGRRAVAT